MKNYYLLKKFLPAGRRLSLCILILSLSSMTAYSQKDSFSLNMQQVSLQSIIDEIERSSEFVFVFSEEVLDDLEQVESIAVTNISIDSLLQQLFTQFDLQYHLQDKQVVVYKQEKAETITKQEIQQPHPVKGLVRDENGEPVVGATVLIKGTRKGVVTDFYGMYQFKDVPEDATLEISYLGFQTQEVPVEGRKEIDVVLITNLEDLEEVVITSSYGTEQKKDNVVSSVYEVTSDEFKHLPAQRVDQMLEGLVPGLMYSPQSDDAVSARPRFSVNIRGEASMAASNEPLWIIDGVPIHTGDRTNSIRGMQTSVSPLSYLNPMDIESMTVLKDASATSLYGADGANGVIIITTKRGQPGGLQLSVDTQFGVTQINEATRFKVLNADQYRELAEESYRNAGLPMNQYPWQDNGLNRYSGADVDWYDMFFDTGYNSLLNLTASGGTDNVTYYIGGSYYQTVPTVKGNKQERFTLRTNNTVMFNDKLTLDVNLSASYNTNSLFTPHHEYYENLPILSPYYEDGTYRLYYRMVNGVDAQGNPNFVDRRFFNAVAEREQNDNNQRALAVNGFFQLRYDILENLSYTGMFGVDLQSSDEDIYNSMKNWSGMTTGGEPGGNARWSYANFFGWSTIHRLNYRKSFGKHEISAMAAFDAKSSDNRTISSYGSGFVNDYIRAVTYAAHRQGSSGKHSTRSLSYLGNLYYTYDGRYMIQANMRKDGNSGFGKDVRWADFASLGLRWNLHNEAFFKVPAINHLSIKGSYGSNGNSRLGANEASGIYSIGESYNYAGELGGAMSRAPNPTLSWETTYMANAGLRLGLFDNRIELDTEIYRNKTENLLSNLDVSKTTGASQIRRNMGTVENKGIEATLSTRNIMTQDFTWSTVLIGSHNRNKILDLYNDIPKNFNNTRYEVGKDMNTYYLVRWAGVDPRDGAPLWLDSNGNVTRVYNNLQDRVAHKNATPDVFGSFMNNLRYKNFNLRIQANYTIGGYAFSSYGRNVSSDGLNIMQGNQSVNQLDRWQNPGDVVSAPKPLWGISTKSVMHSTRYLYSKTHIKLQQVSLSYDVYPDVAERLGFFALSFSLNGHNLGVWTPHANPDRNSYKTNMYGVPMETGVSLSLHASF